ncbi:hypothetical protein KEH51_19305 [[Brevibacterium] frigoritolerans]|uniref:Uncharacterized protein n=1 Tax=Peribacillus frigoritolerans TaxID=450367 RepID=A0A941FMG9_9BACI|nr:hypothetical protein [Peribacillus frigoritolerans]
MIGAEVRDSCGSSRTGGTGGTGETPQAFTSESFTARPAESEHLEGKSTTTHYLVNSNKVCENSLKKAYPLWACFSLPIQLSVLSKS